MRAAALVVAVALLGCGAAAAADWGTITPGESTTAGVRAEYGEPSRADKKKVDGYDTTEWTYEGDRAPLGMKRMVVDFGILKPSGYQPAVVRTFHLEPKPGVFRRTDIILGWGKPDQAGTRDGVPVVIYESGLVVYFDKGIVNAVSMWFTVPRPATGSEGAPPASKAPAPKDKR